MTEWFSQALSVVWQSIFAIYLPVSAHLPRTGGENAFVDRALLFWNSWISLGGETGASSGSARTLSPFAYQNTAFNPLKPRHWCRFKWRNVIVKRQETQGGTVHNISPRAPQWLERLGKEADGERRDDISIYFQFTSVDICIWSSRNICHCASLNFPLQPFLY